MKSLSYAELAEFCMAHSLPSYKAEQIFSWLYRGVTSFDEMSNLSKQDREKLSNLAFISVPTIEKKQVSAKDGTVKYLWKLSDGQCVESVVMRYKYGISICVSTQAGCKMGCKFCASTIATFGRNLTASEILDEVIFAQKDIGERISNVVLMGIGEPLDNFDNVIRFLENINHEKGLNIGYRHISLSTCGLVDKLEELLKKKLPITLSVSLHAPTDEVRDKIMPINHKFKINKLLEFCAKYAKITSRRISFEYILIKDVNDSEEMATILANKLRGMLCHVNLIPVNEIKESSFTPTDSPQVERFKNRLIRLGINATVRRKLGSDIDASCGQLRKADMT